MPGTVGWLGLAAERPRVFHTAFGRLGLRLLFLVALVQGLRFFDVHGRDVTPPTYPVDLSQRTHCQTQFDSLNLRAMNCAEQLVEIFGTQADVARAFQLDRAVVHNWVKTGYVPARWAGEVERVNQGRINSADVGNEASAKNPVRAKSRSEHMPFSLSAR